MFFICRINISPQDPNPISTQEDKDMDIVMEEISTFTYMFGKAQHAIATKIPENAPKHSIEKLILQLGSQVSIIS
jgi:hypothetical protein